MKVRRMRLSQLGLLSLALLAFTLPFELEAPSISIGSFRLTNVEAQLALTLLLGTVIVVSERRWRREGWTAFPAAWLWLWAFYALALVLSGFLAPDFQDNALKASIRSLSGLSLALIVPQIVRSRGQFTWIVVALLAGGAVAVAAGLYEMWSGTILAGLEPFRVQATVAGPFLRLSGPFNHANQVAMFVEATLPLLVAGVWMAFRQGRPLPSVLATLTTLLFLQVAFLTYSRASYVTIFLSNLFIAGLLLWRRPARHWRIALPWLGLAIGILLVVAVNGWFSPVLRLRLSTEGDNEWYDLQLQVPPRMDIAAGGRETVTLTVINEGALTWSSDGPTPIRVGGRWQRQSDGGELAAEARWPFDRIVKPGERLTMSVPVQAPPEPGEYWLEWDLVQEDVTWFSAKNGQRTRSRVSVTERAASNLEPAEPILTGARPAPRPIPDRRTLWRLAGQQFADRPLLGIGPDNFRLTHGRVAGWPEWNRTIHTNNWYIESLVSLGLLGALPFFAWLILLGLDIVRRIRELVSLSDLESVTTVAVWQIALATGLVAFLIHGLLDYFLLFNGTALLFWLLVGFWVTLRSHNQRERGAW